MRIKFMKSEFVVFAFGLVAFSAVAALPTGYTELKYLKGTGAQKIVLDYTPSATDVIEVKVRLADKSSFRTAARRSSRLRRSVNT